MTTTTETPAICYCRHCKEVIRRIEGEWTDPDGCVVCLGNMTSLTAGHQPYCPPSEVRDMIIPWSDVGEGDLVLQEDDLIIAEKVHVYQDTWNRETAETFTRVDITYHQDGHRLCSEHHGDRLTAVRRYITEG